MDRTRKYNIGKIALVALSVVALTGFGCKPRAENADNVFDGSDVKLVVWGLWQESSDMEPVIVKFQEDTGAEVEYKKISSVAEYEKELIEAIAEGRGPDVFVIHHSWVEDKRGIMTPAPADVADERLLVEEFVDVVSDDLVRNGKVYALPLSVDSLALYYNKDLLSASGVARPPKTWQEFQQVVERLTRVNRFGTIEQSGAALGAAQNVSRAGDILQLLLMQSGLDIASNQTNQVSINNEIGERSYTFYTDFANKSKKVYTWDLQQDYSIDAFAEGETAMMINYSYHIPTIKAKNPRLRFGIAPAPQIADSKTVVNFAAYWPYAVSSRSSSPSAAWQFVKSLTSAESSAIINRSQQTPPARREAVANQARDPLLGAFAEQALTSKTWPRGDVVAIDAIFNTAIDSIITGAATIEESLSRTEAQLNQIQPEPVIPVEEGDDSGGVQSSGGIGIF